MDKFNESRVNAIKKDEDIEKEEAEERQKANKFKLRSIAAKKGEPYVVEAAQGMIEND